MKRLLALLFVLCLIANACGAALAGEIDGLYAEPEELAAEVGLPDELPEADEAVQGDMSLSDADGSDPDESYVVDADEVAAEVGEVVAEAEDVSIGGDALILGNPPTSEEIGENPNQNDPTEGGGENANQNDPAEGGGENANQNDPVEGGSTGSDGQGSDVNPGSEDGTEATVAPTPTPAPTIPVYTIQKTGETKKLKLGSTLQLAVKGKKIKSCVSATKSVATVSKAGKVKAKKAGKTVITVTLTNNKKLKLTIKVVDPTMPTSVTIQQGSRKMLSVGEKFELTALVKPATAPQTVTWKSASKAVATVNSKGVVTARKPGSVKITATSRKNGKKDTFTVVVRTKVPKAYMISHAMGGIGGRKYSNCREGFLENYAEGHRIFEVDMEYTSDGKLVLFHDWKGQFDPKYKAGYKPTYKQFMQAKIFGKYTPMDVKSLIKLMNQYPDVRIVTDTKYTDTATIRKQFRTIVSTARNLGMSDVLNRFVVEIYTPEMYRAVHSIYHFKEYMVTLYKAYKKAPTASEMHAVGRFCKRHKIKTVAMYARWWKKSYEAILASYDLDIALYSVNSTKKAKTFFRQGVTALFTDFMPPI